MASAKGQATAEASSGEKQAMAVINEVLAGKKTMGEALGINAGQAYNMARMGYKLLQEGKLEDAKAVFKGLTTLNPKDPYMWLALGSACHRMADVDGAIAAYSKAIELDPKNANAYANRGELYIVTKQFEKGFVDLKKAVDLDPKGQDPATVRARAILATTASKMKEKGVKVATKKR